MPNTRSDCSEPTRHSELLATSPCFVSKSMVVSVLESYTTRSSPSSSFPGRPGLISSAPFTWLNEPERKLECTRETCGAAEPCLHCLSIVYTSVPAVSVLAASAGMISVIFLGSMWTVKPKIRTEAVRGQYILCVDHVRAWKMTWAGKQYYFLLQIVLHSSK